MLRAYRPLGKCVGTVCGYKGKEAGRLVVRTAPGVVSLVAELRGHQRQAAEKLGQWKTGVEKRMPPDASPTAVTLPALYRCGA